MLHYFHDGRALPPLEKLDRPSLYQSYWMLKMLLTARSNLLGALHPEMVDREIFQYQIRRKTFTVLNHPDYFHQVLVERMENYPKGQFYKSLLSGPLGEGSIMLSGEAWKQRRRLINPAFQARALKKLERIIEAHTQKLIERWSGLPLGHAINLNREMTALTMAIAVEAFFSESLLPEDGDIGGKIDFLLNDFGNPPFADFLGLPSWVPRRDRSEAKEKLAEIDQFLYRLIEARRAQPRGEDKDPDLLDLLLEARDEETGAALSHQEVRDEVMTLFSAGHETTALSLAWGLDRLAREKAWADRLGEAAMAALEGPPPDTHSPLTWEQARALPDLPEAYDEILRLYPPAYLFGRDAVNHDIIGGAVIPAGSRVQVPIILMHYNPRYWDEPERFDPTRFTAKARKERPPLAYLPFGAGPRMCVGLAFARMEAITILANILARFELTPVNLEPRPVGRITLRMEDPAFLRISPRVAEVKSTKKAVA